MKKEIIKQGQNEVIIHQDVARIRGRLTPVQSKCMLSILKRANEQVLHDKDIKKFTISTNILLEDIQDKDTSGFQSVVKKIDKQLDDLMTIKFVWGTEKALEKCVFVQQIKITEKEVTFKFSDYIREHIKPISTALIMRDFVLIQSFRSEYARQLYKHLMMWEKKQSCYLSIKDFKDFLGVPDSTSYKRMDVLKRKVLNVAINEINEKCPYMQLKYINRTKKRSKTIEGFDFGWFNKPEKEKTPQLFAPKPNKFEEFKYKKIQTEDGKKEINFIEDLGDFLKVYFIDGEHAQIKNIEILKGLVK